MDKALRYLGLAAKAGRLIIGAEDCAKELKRHKTGLLIAAADAAGNTLAQIQTAADSRGVLIIHTPYAKQEIAGAIGRVNPVAIALICDEGLAKAFAAALETDRKQEERV